MTVRYSSALCSALANDKGFASAFANCCICLYSGPQPLKADDAATGTLLGRFTLNGGAWTAGSPTNGLNFVPVPGTPGLVQVDPITAKMTGLAAGTAGWFRIYANAADDGLATTTAYRVDGTAGVGTGDMLVRTLSITVGMPMSIDELSYRQPAA